MKVPRIFLDYKMPYEKQDFLSRYFNRHDENLRERWALRGLIRWLRNFQHKDVSHCISNGSYWETTKGYLGSEEAFKAVFG